MYLEKENNMEEQLHRKDQDMIEMRKIFED